MTVQPLASDPVFLLYDGECPFCTNAAQYAALKKAYPTIKLVSFRDTLEIQNLNLPSDLNPNRGMVLLIDKHPPLQGVDAFIEINKTLGKQGFFHKILSSRVLAQVIYPCLLGIRRISLFLKGSSHIIPKNDF